jgi:hypothetical protein
MKGASTLVGSGRTYKHYTRLKRLARGKNSSLLQTSVNCNRKKLNNIGSRGH